MNTITPRATLIERRDERRDQLAAVQLQLDAVDAAYEKQKAALLEHADRLATEIRQYDTAIDLLDAPDAEDLAEAVTAR